MATLGWQALAILGGIALGAGLIALDVNGTKLRHRFHRVRGRLRRFACRRRGLHTSNGGDWGYGMNGMVEASARTVCS
jgi:hypothetical protein